MKIILGNKKEAKEYNDGYNGLLVEKAKEVVKEDISRRSINGKVFNLGDKEAFAEISGRSLHYLSLETGKYEDIDNRLLDTGESLETTANAFKTRFIKSSAAGKIFELIKEDCRVSLFSQDVASRNGCLSEFSADTSRSVSQEGTAGCGALRLEHCVCAKEPAFGDGNGKAPSQTVSRVVLREVKEFVDFEYIVDPDRIKENIIVKSPLTTYEFNFELHTKNLSAVVSDDGKTLHLLSRTTKEVHFIIPAPFMTDASNCYSDKVSYEIEQDSADLLKVKLIADASHFIVTGYPLHVGNAWGAGLFDLPNTKVSLSLKPVEKSKATRRIDNAILELSARAGNKASEVIDKSTHLETLSALLSSLQNDNETMLDTTLLITAYDEPDKNTVKRAVKRKLKELGFNYTETIGRQADAYLANGFYDKLNSSRGIQSSSVAACFPFVSNAVVEDDGLLIGENDLPVFADFFKRDNERVNSNMVIVGKPGSGKSYAAKTMLCNLASCGTKIFVLDPENEYSKVTESLGGKVLDAASSKYGIINPFQVIAGMKDDNDTETGNDFYAHLRFLEQFFKTAFAGLNSDCLELLNKATLDSYRKKGVTSDSKLEKLTAESYPTFDDLSLVVDERAEKETDQYTLSCIKTIQNYLSKFKSGGRNSALWNGVSSFNLSENFVCFNFQKLLADKNETVANAQMLLILKWLENEVIKNREYNMRFGTSRKMAVVIDEAHLFVNEQYPVALDFMFQLAKRIRKYDGMQIVITQNIKDFAGTPEIARKSTAIINVSQYSLIFSLSPNDMTDLCKLYEKAGEINESEQASIVYNPRGRAFFIYGAANRTNIAIKATPYVESLFM